MLIDTLYKVTSPQAFEGLRLKNRNVRRPDLTLEWQTINVPTTSRKLGIDSIKDKIARIQVETLEKNLKEHKIEYIPLTVLNKVLYHIIGPEM